MEESASSWLADGKGDKLDFMRLGRALRLFMLASSRGGVLCWVGISVVPKTLEALDVLFLLFSERRSSWLSLPNAGV